MYVVYSSKTAKKIPQNNLSVIRQVTQLNLSDSDSTNSWIDAGGDDELFSINGCVIIFHDFVQWFSIRTNTRGGPSARPNHTKIPYTKYIK